MRCIFQPKRAGHLAGALLLAALGAASLSARADEVSDGVRAAALAAAGGPKPFVDTVCPWMEQEAEAKALPPMVFVRLIWKESRFNPEAVSPKGAQGIAQFMPATAEDRGLDDPFEPRAAIVHSASSARRSARASSAISGSRPRPITPAPSGCGNG